MQTQAAAIAPVTINFTDAQPTKDRNKYEIQQAALYPEPPSNASLGFIIKRFIQKEFYWQAEQGTKVLYYRPRDRVKNYAYAHVVSITMKYLKKELVHKDDGGLKVVGEVLQQISHNLEPIKLGESIYRPDKPRVVNVMGTNVENLWEVPTVKPLADYTPEGGKAKPFEDMLLKNFQGDRGKQQWVLDWLAFQWQRPLVELHHHCYLYSDKQGQGKGMLKDTLRDVFGMSAVATVLNLKALEDKSGQVDALVRTMMLIQEYPPSTTTKQKNDLKNWTTESILWAARKNEGMRPHQIHANFLFQSNNPPTMFDGKEDRRWFVAEWYSDDYKDDAAKDIYFNGYANWRLNEGGSEAIAAMLRDRDISHYNVASKPLQTPELLKALQVTTDEYVTLVEDYLEQHADRPVFSAKELQELYKDTKLRGNLNAIQHNLAKVGLMREVKQVNIPRSNGKKLAIYVREGITLVRQQPRSVLMPSGDDLNKWLMKMPKPEEQERFERSCSHEDF